MVLSSKIRKFGVEVFTGLELKKMEMERCGRKVYNLSIGTPDSPAPDEVRRALSEAADEPDAWKYALFDIPEMIQALTGHYRDRYGVSVLPEQITSVAGTQTGLTHALLVLCDPGDTILIPDPCYPGFLSSAYTAGVNAVYYPLLRENSFMPDLFSIPADAAKAAKVIVVNFPSNPIGCTVRDGFFDELVRWARANDVFVIHDGAYRDLVFDLDRGTSFLEAEGADEVGIELFSLSKSFCITGARIGFAVGNTEAVKAIRTLREHIDFGMFIPLQRAAAAALSLPKSYTDDLCGIYRKRRDVFIDGLRRVGWDADAPDGSIFCWCRLPEGYEDSEEFGDILLEKSGVLCAPGAFFGPNGRQYVRFALVEEPDILTDAVNAIKESGIL